MYYRFFGHYPRKVLDKYWKNYSASIASVLRQIDLHENVVPFCCSYNQMYCTYYSLFGGISCMINIFYNLLTKISKTKTILKSEKYMRMNSTAAPKSRHGKCCSLCSISQLCKRTNAFHRHKFVVTASLEFQISCQSYRCSSCSFINVKIIWNRLSGFVSFFVWVRCHINKIFSIAFRWSLVIV